MPERALRADARRNRTKILDAAAAAFARDGAEVSLDAVAARAGVGPGTVHRHFPTKESLIAAVVAARLNLIADRAEEMLADPSADFFAFLAELGAAARHNMVLASALGGTLGTEGDEAAVRLSHGLESLLRSAQQAALVRADLTVAELHAVIGGAIAIEQRLPDGREGLGLEIVFAGLRTSAR